MELYYVRRTRFIQAHAAALACLTLSQDGRLLATASERGTLVRIHSTADGSRLQARAAGWHQEDRWGFVRRTEGLALLRHSMQALL